MLHNCHCENEDSLSLRNHSLMLCSRTMGYALAFFIFGASFCHQIWIKAAANSAGDNSRWLCWSCRSSEKKTVKNSSECGLITIMSLSWQELPLGGIVLSTGDLSSPQRHLQSAAYMTEEGDFQREVVQLCVILNQRWFCDTNSERDPGVFFWVTAFVYNYNVFALVDSKVWWFNNPGCSHVVLWWRSLQQVFVEGITDTSFPC